MTVMIMRILLFEAGAVAALVDKKIDSAIPQIITNNSLDALVDLAKAAVSAALPRLLLSLVLLAKRARKPSLPLA